ncbi:MAG: RDD family protein [Ruminococcaceae bacterium]|nr:RDD family protein [Oscillospiraceae bacterium]
MICDLQKASLWKRASSFLFDVIIFAVVAIGIAALMSTILKFDERDDLIEQRKEAYVKKYEAEYLAEHGESCELNLDLPYDEMSDGQKEIYANVDKALRSDSSVSHAYMMVISLSFVMITVSAMIANILLEFVVPMILGNGQTFGKKLFGLGVMRTNSVKATPVALFIRMLLGKHTIETMVPVALILMMYFGIIGIVGPIVILGFIILEIVVVCTTHTNSMIHDLISDTVVVDIHTQMIFESEQALIDYKKKLHEEEVSRAKY